MAGQDLLSSLQSRAGAPAHSARTMRRGVGCAAAWRRATSARSSAAAARRAACASPAASASPCARAAAPRTALASPQVCKLPAAACSFRVPPPIAQLGTDEHEAASARRRTGRSLCSLSLHIRTRGYLGWPLPCRRRGPAGRTRHNMPFQQQACDMWL